MLPSRVGSLRAFASLEHADMARNRNPTDHRDLTSRIRQVVG